MIENVKVFARDFCRAMGDRNNFMTAVRRAAVTVAVVYAFLGVMTLAQVMGR